MYLPIGEYNTVNIYIYISYIIRIIYIMYLEYSRESGVCSTGARV